MRQETLSRREFLRVGRRSESGGIRPPGIEERALVACTGCGACVEHCPTGIIALSEGRPTLDFAVGACTFCGACAAVCPEPVFADEVPNTFDHIIAIAGSCLAFQRVDCQACRDACPTEAIRFRPVRGGPFVPSLVAADCTGCGACMSVCPVGAITIAANGAEAHHG